MPLLSYFRSAVALLLVLALASCASTGDPRIHQARSKFQSRNTYAQGIVGGAVLGALGGALIGGLTAAATNQSFAQGAVKGAIIGSVAGATSGGFYAHDKVEQRRSYLAREQNLNAAIRNARSTRLAATDYNRVLSSRLTQAKSTAASRAADVNDSNVVLESVNKEIGRQRQLLSEAKGSNLSDRDREQLQVEVNGLEAERHQLEHNIGVLHSAAPAPGLATR